MCGRTCRSWGRAHLLRDPTSLDLLGFSLRLAHRHTHPSSACSFHLISSSPPASVYLLQVTECLSRPRASPFLALHRLRWNLGARSHPCLRGGPGDWGNSAPAGWGLTSWWAPRAVEEVGAGKQERDPLQALGVLSHQGGLRTELGLDPNAHGLGQEDPAVRSPSQPPSSDGVGEGPAPGRVAHSSSPTTQNGSGGGGGQL